MDKIEDIVRIIEVTDIDRRTLAAIDVDLDQQENDFYDYSKTVVRKPWGYEYLVFQNDNVAVWVLYIKHGYATSLHCHPQKKTSLIVLAGDVLCSTLESEYVMHYGEAILFYKGVFHRTESIVEEGSFVMEVETPVNKRGLVRLVDDYGRERMGYESPDYFEARSENYNYISFIDPNVYYNSKRTFTDCSIELKKIVSLRFFVEILKTQEWDLLTILNGEVLDDSGHIVFAAGDTFSRADVNCKDGIKIKGELEVIVVRKADPMMRFAEFLVSHLTKRDVKEFFFVADSSNAHLIDAIVRNTEIIYFSFQTEHAAMLAAEAHAKLTEKPCVVVVSSGASCSSSLTGVADSWVDSTPLFVISSQSRVSELGVPDSMRIRQLANKEIDIVGIVRPITKYSVAISEPLVIKRELDRALSFCTSGRRGPVWIDIPIDILGKNINEADILSLETGQIKSNEVENFINKSVDDLFTLLEKSSRPVIIVGYGVRAANAQPEFLALARSLSVPILASRRGADLISDDFSLFFGRPGTYGQRSANFVIQNADLLISLGARLSIPLIGRNYTAFARDAIKVVVDVDQQELEKSTVSVDLAIHADVGEVIRSMCNSLRDRNIIPRKKWFDRCKYWRDRYPPKRDYGYSNKEGVNPYVFIENLSEIMGGDDILVVDGGSSLDYVMQAFKVKTGQRLISSPGLECQGFSLPGSIGLCLASRGNSIICLCDRKGFQLNIAELQTIVYNELPIKIFVFNSKIDTHIQRVQTSYFGSRCTEFPRDNVMELLDISTLGKCYKIQTNVITQDEELQNEIRKTLMIKGPALCEVRLPDGQEIIPRLLFKVKPDGKWSSKPLEDMYPYLNRKELESSMVIDVLEEY